MRPLGILKTLSLDNLKTLKPYLLKSNLSNQEIAFLVSRLQKNFTTNRDELSLYHSNDELISAYTAFYLPSNYKKAAYCFDTALPYFSEASDTVEITDVGCSWEQCLGAFVRNCSVKT